MRSTLGGTPPSEEIHFVESVYLNLTRMPPAPLPKTGEGAGGEVSVPRRYLVLGQPVEDVKKEISRNLRHLMTPEKDILWETLRNRKLGAKFRRQQVINGFIADFYCHEHGLIIEADGSHHSHEADCERDSILTSHNLTVLRFSNIQIRQNISQIISKIKDVLNHS